MVTSTTRWRRHHGDQHRASGAPTFASMRIAVVGAHLEGQPLNHQLTSRGATFLRRAVTAPVYRLFVLPTDPPTPGLVRVLDGDEGARPIEVEVWDIEPAEFASFVDEIPSPLAIGRVVLQDRDDVAGFLCEPFALQGAPEITEDGGWRAYLARTTAS